MFFAAVAMTAGIASAQDINSVTETYNNGAMELEMGNKEAALGYFQAALTAAEELGEEGMQIADNCKNTIPVLMNSIAKDYIKAEQFDAALEQLNKTIEAAGLYGNAEVAEDAKALINQTLMAKGNDMINNKDFAGAIEVYNQISQNEKMQTEFISSLSHELRTPLTAITGWGETLLSYDEMDPEETRRGMTIILREARRLTEMVVDLLDFTRIQDGRMTLNVEMTDIRAEFEDTVFMYGSRLKQEGILINYQDSEEDIPEISCDPKRMRQVFLNILDNAAKHGGGEKIDASIGCEDGSVLIRIRDFGPGIPEDEIPLVKKKFYKGSSKARGSGIGLAVCDEIVQLHGGELELRNVGGGGTMVTISLPINQ